MVMETLYRVLVQDALDTEESHVHFVMAKEQKTAVHVMDWE